MGSGGSEGAFQGRGHHRRGGHFDQLAGEVDEAAQFHDLPYRQTLAQVEVQDEAHVGRADGIARQNAPGGGHGQPEGGAGVPSQEAAPAPGRAPLGGG